MYQLALDKDEDVRSFVYDLVDPVQLAQREKELKILMAEQQRRDSSGTPMQDIEEGPDDSSSLAGSISGLHVYDPADESKRPLHEEDEEDREEDVEVEEEQEEEEVEAVGTPMDCGEEPDEDGDATMTDASDDEKAQHPSHHSPQQQEQPYHHASMHEPSTQQNGTDDKEKDEYVYLSKNMVQHDEPSPQQQSHLQQHTGTTSASSTSTPSTTEESA